MILLFTSIILIIICYVLYVKYIKDNWNCSFFLEFSTLSICALSAITLFISILFISLRGYDYNLLLVQRNEFQKSLNLARENKNEFELATIQKEVIQFNIELSKNKYKSKTLLFKDFYHKDFYKIEVVK